MTFESVEDGDQEFAELDVRIEHYNEVSKIVGYLQTPKTEDEFAFIENKLNYVGRCYVTEKIRVESFQEQDPVRSLTYRAESILGSIWDAIISLVKRIIRLIDRAIYAARDFVFGKPTGLVNTEEVSIFRRGVLIGRDYKVPYSSPLQAILVREGSKEGAVRTAEAILNAIEISAKSLGTMTDATTLKKLLDFMAETANPDKATRLEIEKQSNQLQSMILAGVNPKDIKTSDGVLRTSARTVIYMTSADENATITTYTIPSERLPRQEFVVPGVTILRALDNIENVVKVLDKLITFEQKELKGALVKLEADLLQKKKQNATEDQINMLRNVLGSFRNFAAIVDKFQETYRPLRDFKWLNNIELVG